jgi:hypothetical protein
LKTRRITDAFPHSHLICWLSLNELARLSILRGHSDGVICAHCRFRAQPNKPIGCDVVSWPDPEPDRCGYVSESEDSYSLFG